MVWSNCPDDSKKVKQLYVNLMLLVISLLTLFAPREKNILHTYDGIEHVDSLTDLLKPQS